MSRRYVTVSIPYVNAPPHLGYALELVQADALVRHHRAGGDDVRLLGGTDDNSLKNVLAAEERGISTAELVAQNADRFAGLAGPLAVSFDDFIRTSRDPRHRPGVERLWRASAAAGDYYRKWYEGDYCVGCEQFYVPGDLVDGRCPEHLVPTERVAEENWFFRLSRYQGTLASLIQSGRLRIEPERHRREALAFVQAGLEDISVSRSAARAKGWGIPVPGDPGQVVYVWWDALANYITALGYAADGDDYRRWWVEADHRVHVIGKGILRFHAVYWPALLLSAGEPLPTALYVHPYLTVDGRKLSKSAGAHVDPVEVVDRYGTDALRWWLLHDVPPAADADFTVERLVARHDDDLANGIGNLAARVLALVRRAGQPAATRPDLHGELVAVAAELPARVATALDSFDFRAATDAVLDAVAVANRHIEAVRPWERPGAERDRCLASALHLLHAIASALGPFVPGIARRLTDALSTTNAEICRIVRLTGARSDNGRGSAVAKGAGEVVGVEGGVDR